MSQFQKLTSKKETSVENEKELSESEILHEIMKRCWGVNFVSPIEQELTIRKDFKVLDVGCGSGTWLLELSENYPLTNFVGVDKISKFPKDFSQNNLQFITGDILNRLPFEDNFFDFVHMSFVIMEFTDEQWEDIIIKELVRVCKPGGWIEFLEIEESKYLSPSSKRLLALGNLFKNFFLSFVFLKRFNFEIKL